MTVGEFERDFHVLFDQQDRNSLVVQALDEVLDLSDDEGREALGGFVQQEEVGPRDERASERKYTSRLGGAFRAKAVRWIPNERLGLAGGYGDGECYFLPHI